MLTGGRGPRGLTRRAGSAVTEVVCQDTDATGRLVALRTGVTVCPGGAGDVLVTTLTEISPDLLAETPYL